MLTSLWPLRSLLGELTRRDLRQRYSGSAGGWLWLAARPLVTVASYYFIFDLVFQTRLSGSQGTTHFGLYLLVGLLPWLAFSEGIGRGAASLLESAHLLQKTALPVELFPARAVLSAALIYFPVVFLLALAVAAQRVHFLGLLVLPLWMAVQVTMSYQMALVVAILSAALRDVEQMVNLLLGVLVFFAPILYPMEQMHGGLASLLWFNPVTPLALGYYALVLQGTMPPPEVLLAVAGWTAGFWALGALLLRRSREQLVDWL